VERATEGLRTAALALGFVTGLKVSTLMGVENRVAGTLAFMVIWLVGGACYWRLSKRPEMLEHQTPGARVVWHWGALLFNIACVVTLGMLWGRG
jgi:hypothetical protein